MVTRLVVRMALLSFAANFAFANSFTIDDLKGASNANQDAFSSSSQRLKSVRNQGLEVLDHSSVIYEINEKTFPGYILPNGIVVPAIVNSTTGDRIPACLDKFFQRHPAVYDPVSGMVTCKIKQADLLDIVDNQKSVGTTAARPLPGTVVAQEEKPTAVSKYDNAPKAEPVKPTVEKKPTAEKTTANKHTASPTKPKQTTAPKAPLVADDMYLPAVRVAGSSNSSGFAIASSTDVNFGITKGTWVKAEIKRRVRSSDRGEIELVTVEAAYGDQRTLPAGTAIFAVPSFNGGSKRLDLAVTNFIFEDETLPMSAVVYDSSKEFGIAGKLIRDRESEFASAGSEALLTTVGSAVGQVPFAGDPLSEGAASMTDSLIGYESGYLPDARDAVVEAPPQVVYIQIMASF